MTDSARAIENLVYHYAELMDAGDFPAVAQLFRHACIVAPDGTETCGYEAVLHMYHHSTRIYPETGTPCTRHITSNVQVEVDDVAGTAHSRSYFTVYQALPDFPLQAIIAGRYVDQFALHEQQWQFSRRAMYPELFGDLSGHLLFDADTLIR
jgi:3-phenylpropionate/cinnamic acid dioxygenase small subunit